MRRARDRRSMWRAVCLAPLVFAVSLVAIVRAAGLADYVPADVGICVQAHDLPARMRAFLDGPLGQRLRAHHVVKEWHARQGGDLQNLRLALEAHFEMPLGELCDGLAGEELLLGIWPDDTPGGGKGPAVLLLRARDPDVLRRAMQALQDEQRKAGKLLEPEKVVVAGNTQLLQVIAPEQDDSRLYLTTAGDLGVLSNTSSLAVSVLERHAAGVESAAGSLSSLPAYQAALARLDSNCAITLFVNPRTWDAALGASIKAEQADEEVSKDDREKALAAWRGTEYLVAGVALGESVQLSAVWHAQPEALPAEARELADAISGRAGFLEFVPNHALVALAGRAQWGRLARLVWGELAAGNADADQSPAAVAAADAIIQLLERLGPDCGAFVTAAPDKPPSKLPIELGFGLETPSRLPRELAETARDTADQSLRGALALLTVLYNQEHPGAQAGLRTQRVDGVPLTCLVGVKELGDVRPTYTMSVEGLLVGTSPAAVAQATKIAVEASLGRSPRVTRVLSGRWSEPSQVLYVDLRGLRELLAKHDGFKQHLIRHSQSPEADAERGINELVGLLGLADTLVGACKVAPGDLAATLHVATE